MSIDSTKTDVYTDFAGLAQLRLNGQSNPDETLRAAGRQFESLFIQMMLKSMRDAAPREECVAAMWPAAQASARELGVDPRVLIAQAALETGWGRAVMQHGDGRSSHNLFGIKAGNNWSGASVNVATLEYRDGLAAKERANFRSYDSYEQSFADYVDFIKSQPRYREALAHGGDARRYLSELQSAGYATDPRYADKIGSILQGEVLSGRSSDLTGSGGGPIA